MPSQSDEATNAPIFGNQELFQVDLGVEEEDLEEQIQCDANVNIMAASIHNEKKCQDWEDWKRRKTRRRRKRRTMRPRRRPSKMPGGGKLWWDHCFFHASGN